MLAFYAHKFFNISSTLSILEHTLIDDDGQALTPTAEFCADVTKRLISMREECLAADLTFSVRQVDRVLQILQQTNMNVVLHANLAGAIQSLAVRIQDELQGLLVIHIPRDREPFYSDPRGQFGKSTLDRFPSVVGEVESAGKCYATGNYTASVFHLMRVMECGLRVLGESLRDPNLNQAHNPNWGTILRRCDDELRKPALQRSVGWREEERFYAEATANLRAVKDAWRNPTMHVDQAYDCEQALAVFNAVKGFMRHLAKKLTD